MKDWKPAEANIEFDKLLECLIQLLKQPRGAVASKTAQQGRYSSSQRPRIYTARLPQLRFAIGGISILAVLKDLGIRIAFVRKEQNVSALGLLQAGAIVMEVESGLPVGKGGLQAGDIITTISGKKINPTDNLRQALRQLGPAKTTFSVRRGDETNTIIVEAEKKFRPIKGYQEILLLKERLNPSRIQQKEVQTVEVA